MSSPTTPDAAHRLLRHLADSARGPRKQGVYALWLVVRVATDVADSHSSERSHRRRVQALEQRLTSLVLPMPLRRALQNTIEELRLGTVDAAARALVELTATTREALGPDVGDCVHGAAREVKARVAATLRKN